MKRGEEEVRGRGEMEEKKRKEAEVMWKGG